MWCSFPSHSDFHIVFPYLFIFALVNAVISSLTIFPSIPFLLPKSCQSFLRSSQIPSFLIYSSLSLHYSLTFGLMSFNNIVLYCFLSFCVCFLSGESLKFLEIRSCNTLIFLTFLFVVEIVKFES